LQLPFTGGLATWGKGRRGLEGEEGKEKRKVEVEVIFITHFSNGYYLLKIKLTYIDDMYYIPDLI